jgi:hypothetical protein
MKDAGFFVPAEKRHRFVIRLPKPGARQEEILKPPQCAMQGEVRAGTAWAAVPAVSVWLEQ